jgi:hypothetical protein
MALGSRPTRRRGPRWLMLAVIASVVVLAVNAAMKARSLAPARDLAQQTYLDQVLPAIQQSSQEGKDIVTVRTQALSLGATTMANRLREVTTSANQTLTQVQRLTPPRPLQTAHDLLIATLAIRAEGADAFRQAMVVAISGQGSATPVQQIVDVGRDFDAGDRAYALFVKAMPNVNVSMPPSQWVSGVSSYSEPEVTVFLTTLRSAASLAPVHDGSVVLVSTDPSAVGINGTTAVFPISKILNMQIVVADVGNQPEKNLMVTATITPSAIGPSEMVRDFVNLAPGQRRTVKLGGLRPQPGGPTTLTVKIDTAPGETSVADNSKAITFVMQ